MDVCTHLCTGLGASQPAAARSTNPPRFLFLIGRTGCIQGHLSFCILCSLLCGSVCGFIKCSVSSGVPRDAPTCPQKCRAHGRLMKRGRADEVPQCSCDAVCFPSSSLAAVGHSKEISKLVSYTFIYLRVFVCLFVYLLAIVPFNRTV